MTSIAVTCQTNIYAAIQQQQQHILPDKLAEQINAVYLQASIEERLYLSLV